ncbi:uncharacterized protein G2W53_008321 [Senna tora]|uniref:Uncharacterized protein n=1 Tax=Senna tora TaxID=362788 RepID=A0A834X984_9FABA|nr:uncharacterized protein G2W53_008321 [Senna tora]
MAHSTSSLPSFFNPTASFTLAIKDTYSPKLSTNTIVAEPLHSLPQTNAADSASESMEFVEAQLERGE